MKLAPVANAVPPVEVAYQFATEPVAQVAPKVTVPVPQIAAGVVVATAGAGSIVTTISFDSPT